MAHVSLRKIVLASAVAGVIALMSLGTVGCAPKTADLSETGSGRSQRNGQRLTG